MADKKNDAVVNEKSGSVNEKSDSVNEDSRAHLFDDIGEPADEDVDIAPDSLLFLPEDTLSAIDTINTERERLFGLVRDEEITNNNALDVKMLVKHAQKHGLGSLILLFKDAVNCLGYSSSGGNEFIHRKSGVVIKL